MNDIDTSAVPYELVADAVKWRHHLHKHSELAFQERETADFIASQLSSFGLSVHRGLGKTGVVGTLSRGTGRRSIAIRADMDALPIAERSGVSHTSCVAGVMHACGHDGHVAMALAAARTCAQLPDLDGTVHFIFQPAEEVFQPAEGVKSGARRMVDEGLFSLFPCDAVYALHNWPALPLGTFVARDGAMLAALGVFEIAISGRGCHGALPHEGTDVVLAGSQLVSALQSIRSRNIDPRHAAVLSVTQIHGGDSWTTIPGKCTIRGTTRWFDERTGDILEQRIRELSRTTTTGFSCQAQVHYMRCTPATINDSRAASIIRDVASAPPLNLRLMQSEPCTGSEDFAYMLQAVPGCYLLLGSGRPDSTQSLHSPDFDFNDDLLPIGASLWTELVRKCLSIQ